MSCSNWAIGVSNPSWLYMFVAPFRAHNADLFHEIGACLSYSESGSVNSTTASSPRKGCIGSWNNALTPSAIAESLIQSIDLDGSEPSEHYNASVMALGQRAGVLRSAGLFNPATTYIAFILLTIGALVMIAFFVVLHYNKNSLRISCEFLLLLGALCAASSLLFVGGSYFALSRGQGMLSLG
jgi:hypothetical protein